MPRTHPDYAALQLANLIFGGYFSSRWVENIREDKGYTYGPHSLDRALVAGSALVVAAEVATEVTGAGAAGDAVRAGPAWPRLPPSEEELEQARQYALGTLAARHVHPGRSGRRWPARTPASGCGWTACASTPPRLAAATREEVAAAAARYLAPAGR